MLKPLVPGALWLAEMPLRLIGFDLGARMTVVRLPDGGLWLHSPVAPEPGLRRALDDLGPVRCLVAPSRFHFKHAGEWAALYPDAELHAAPGARPRLKRVRVDALLEEAAPPAWRGAIEQVPLRGSVLFDEWDFFHPGTGTLILTDLCFNIPAESSWSTRLLARGLGVLGRLAPSREFRLTLRDPAAMRGSLERLLSWEFDRVVLAHGAILERGGKPAMEKAFARFLR